MGEVPGILAELPRRRSRGATIDDGGKRGMMKLEQVCWVVIDVEVSGHMVPNGKESESRMRLII